MKYLVVESNQFGHQQVVLFSQIFLSAEIV